MKYLVLALAFLLCGFSCKSPLANLKQQECVEPPAEYQSVRLAACKPTPDGVASCCAYPFINVDVGKLCFNVLCSADSCGEYKYEQTICVENGPKAPGKDI